jgi:hypothetical protein
MDSLCWSNQPLIFLMLIFKVTIVFILLLGIILLHVLLGGNLESRIFTYLVGMNGEHLCNLTP